MVGVSDCVGRQRGRCRHFLSYWSDGRAPVVTTSPGKITQASCVGTGGGTRGLEADLAQSTASTISEQFNELSLRAHKNPFSHVHGLDCNRPGSGIISVRLFRNVGPIRAAAGARGDSSAGVRILRLGRGPAGFVSDFAIDGADRGARLAV